MAITQTSLALRQAALNAWVAGDSIKSMQLLMNDITSLNSLGVFLADGNAFTGANTFSLKTTFGSGILEKSTPVDIATTAAGTLAVVTSGVIAGVITTTSAAAVTLTLDSVAHMITAFTAAGLPAPAAGSYYKFIVDNTGGANTVTVAVDSGATIAAITSPITGGATLTVSTANAVGVFALYFSSATAAKLLRLA